MNLLYMATLNHFKTAALDKLNEIQEYEKGHSLCKININIDFKPERNPSSLVKERYFNKQSQNTEN